ncbi:MAG: ABC transporter ATP-binding protein [Phycisphaerales bacterium]|nr:ABC transporter ATP-binding protein [Phycisphaerales bacterium]
MATVIKTVNLTKRYGSLIALSNLNLTIEENDCFGFIGPNGAGKSTTIKILATLLQPTWGEARICDHVIGYQSRLIRPLIGYVPDYFGSYEDMVVQEYLEFFAATYNINGIGRTKVVNDALELTDLGYKRDSLVDALSRGMKQRLSIARVLLHNPKVLLLDEPAGNLDPRARIEMRELLKQLQRMGKTILISSHILPELQDLCNKVGIIERGELLFSGPWTDLIKQTQTGTIVRLAVQSRQDEAAQLLAGQPGVQHVSTDNGCLLVTLAGQVRDYSFIPQRLIAQGFNLTLLQEQQANLETAFMQLTRGIVQ